MISAVETPVVSPVVEGCGVAPVIQWSEVTGASYTVSYGLVGHLVDVEVPAGTTSYTAQLDPGSYVA